MLFDLPVLKLPLQHGRISKSRGGESLKTNYKSTQKIASKSENVYQQLQPLLAIFFLGG